MGPPDAWLISPSKAAQYRADREELAVRLDSAVAARGWKPERGGAGSEDGEYMCGVDAEGDMQTLVQLDPDTTDDFVQARARDNVDNFLDHVMPSAR